MTRKRAIQKKKQVAKKNCKARNNIRTLKEFQVVLYNIASYPEIIPIHLRELFRKQITQLKLCSNESKKPDTVLADTLKENIQKTNSVKNKSTKSRSKSKSTTKNSNKKKCETVKSQLNCEVSSQSVAEDKDDNIFQSKLTRKRLLIFDSRSNDEPQVETKIASVTSDDEFFKVRRGITGRKRMRLESDSESESGLNSSKSDRTHGINMRLAKIDSNSTNCFDEKNLNLINQNNNFREDFIDCTNIKCDNLHSIDFINRTDCNKIKQKQNKAAGNKISSNEILKNVNTVATFENSCYFSDCLSVSDSEIIEKQDQENTKMKLNNENANNEYITMYLKSTCPTEINNVNEAVPKLTKTHDKNDGTIKKNMPKIKQNTNLPLGMVKISKHAVIKGEDVLGFISCIQNKYDYNKNIDQISYFDDALKSAGILEKENKQISSTKSKSTNTSKQELEFDLRCVNVSLDKYIPYNGVHNLLDHKNPNSVTKITKNLDNDISRNNIEQISKNCNTINMNKIQEQNDTKEKRVFNSVQQRETVLPIKHQQFNKLRKTDSTHKNLKCNEENVNESDLRQLLNRKKFGKTSRLASKSDKTVDDTVSEETKSESDISTDLTQTTKIFSQVLPFGKASYKNENNNQVDLNHNDNLHSLNNSVDVTKEMQHVNRIDTLVDTKNQGTDTQSECTSDDTTEKENDDEDCISLFADDMSFGMTKYEETFLDEKQVPHKRLSSTVSYRMSDSSFDKYIKQNENEFNKEYEKYTNNFKKSQNSYKETKTVSNVKPKQIASQQVADTNYVHVTAVNSRLDITRSAEQLNFLYGKNYFDRFCFRYLKGGKCNKYKCVFNHEYQILLDHLSSQQSSKIWSIINYAINSNWFFISQQMFSISIVKLSVGQILTVYRKLRIACHTTDEIIHCIIVEFFAREMPLNIIVENLVAFANPNKDFRDLMYILIDIENYVKPGCYWDSLRTLILLIKPNKRTIEKILRECINYYEDLPKIQDVNETLISKLEPSIKEKLDNNLMISFTNLLTKANYELTASILNFGEPSVVETIASPDSKQSQTASPVEDATLVNNVYNKKTETYKICGVNIPSCVSYKVHAIENLPEPQSAYRDHKHLWKFYVDLERFKRGLEHEDYEYVINILENYVVDDINDITEETSDANQVFVRACGRILRTAIKRSDYHLTNIIQRTVQTSTFDILARVLFDMGCGVLTSLVDNETWGLALQFIRSLSIYETLCNTAEFILLLAEIYLANRKAEKAFDILKHNRIICTSRTKWRVKSTLNDECVRNQIMHILLEALCNEFTGHAFFLFQFLLEDQSSSFYPIDLSRYGNKLILLLLSQNDENLITLMGSLILKYSLSVNEMICRALIATLVHVDQQLAKHLYNYAQMMGFYPSIALYPVKRVIIYSDLTEEEIYLIFLHLMEKLVMNFGHAIELVKYVQVFVILEIRSNRQLYCAAMQKKYNGKAITNIKKLINQVLRRRFDPPMLLMPLAKGRLCRIQNRSIINYLKSRYCDFIN